MTCTETMVRASACVGFTFPGMMEEPGSFSGSVSSPRPQRGPEASQRTSLAIFMSEAASVFSAPEAKTISSRSEEHTSELQSPYDLVCRLLLEKKKKNNKKKTNQNKKKKRKTITNNKSTTHKEKSSDRCKSTYKTTTHMTYATYIHHDQTCRLV